MSQPSHSESSISTVERRNTLPHDIIKNGIDPLLPGSKCEVMSLDARANKKGDYEIKPSTAPLNTSEGSGNEWVEYALTFIRYFDQKGRLDKRKLKIKSPHILKALNSVVPYYPGAPTITEKTVEYESPYCILVHYLEDLRAYQSNSDDDVVKLHVNLLIRVVEVDMAEELNELKDLLPTKKITFPLAWAVFRPGIVGFTNLDGVPEMHRILRTEYIKKFNIAVKLKVIGEQIDYDGATFRYRSRTFFIHAFFGTVDIFSLSIYPLDFHPEPATITQPLADRGRLWFNIQNATPKIVDCDGIFIAGGDDLKSLTTFGRVVIDNGMHDIIIERKKRPETIYKAIIDVLESINKEFSRNSEIEDTEESKIEDLVKVGPNNPLSDDEAALCTAFVRGYSLNKRVWGAFNVSNIKDTEWSLNAFERLILREESKETIMALVQAYIDPTVGITQDLVKGKGLGMIFLLHGPPGVGKTLTAETIAEHTKRPLYAISGGELGTTPVEVEARLSRVLEIATAWKAVVLIDEADIFLQQRDLINLERNSLVAIFLRHLEYFEGLMFLTTNRADCIDEAFRSRIDIALYYPNLSETMRCKLWESSLRSLDPTTLDIDLETAVPELAKDEMNGREIRKVIKAASLMASHYHKKLNLRYLHTLMSFRMVGSLPERVEDFDEAPASRIKRQRRD